MGQQVGREGEGKLGREVSGHRGGAESLGRRFWVGQGGEQLRASTAAEEVGEEVVGEAPRASGEAVG